MTTDYSPDKQLIKDFIRYISDNHKACIVQFPDEFASSQYVNYRFINVSELLDEFVEDNIQSFYTDEQRLLADPEYSKQWVEEEVRKSGQWFLEEIYK